MASQQSLRKALGAIKDSTKVGLAKVNSTYKVDDALRLDYFGFGVRQRACVRSGGWSWG